MGASLLFGERVNGDVLMAIERSHDRVASTHWVILLACQHEWGKHKRLHLKPHSRMKSCLHSGEKLHKKLWSYPETE